MTWERWAILVLLPPVFAAWSYWALVRFVL